MNDPGRLSIGFSNGGPGRGHASLPLLTEALLNILPFDPFHVYDTSVIVLYINFGVH